MPNSAGRRPTTMYTFRSFRSRLVVLFGGLLVAVLTATFLAVNQANVESANRVINADLEEDSAVFARLFSDRTERLLEAARLLSSDFAFKSAYSTAERETILSAMGNHLARFEGADLMMLVSLDDEVLGDTSDPAGEVGEIPWPWLTAAAAEDDWGEATGIVLRDGEALQMMVVPLLIPDLDAWICIGFALDDAYAEELQELISSRVAILHETPAGECRAVASTLSREEKAALPELLKIAPEEMSTATVELMGERWVSTAIPLSESPEGTVMVWLQRSLAAELAPYQRLRNVLILLFAAGLLLSALAAMAIARSVTRPVLDLADGARAIEDGDFSRRVEIHRRDEIGKLAGSFNEMAKGLEEKERVRTLLGKVVSPAIAEELLSKKIELGGEERVVTILFSDVRNFTTLCEGRAPAEILSLLNLYLTEISGIIEANGGVVDKYIGDAVMALFGAPLEHGDDAARAVATALEMSKALDRLNVSFAERDLPELGIGVGVNTDLVVAGNMGSEDRLNYTVIGDGVNLASRLEGLTKRYGISIIASESTREAAPEFLYRELDRVRVKGKKDAVRIFEPLGRRDALDAETIAEHDRFAAARERIRARDWTGARLELARLVEEAEGRRSADLYRVYLERTAGYEASPPPEGWDGTVEFQSK